MPYGLDGTKNDDFRGSCVIEGLVSRSVFVVMDSLLVKGRVITLSLRVFDVLKYPSFDRNRLWACLGVPPF